jgi:branched-chain amino acid transport system substrate-binding protein
MRPSGPARALVTLALSVALAGACAKRTDEIPVGAYLSLTGVDSTFGKDTQQGFDLAAAEVNGAGGIKGKKVRIVYEDDRSLPTETALKVRQLIDRDAVVALLGEVASARSIMGGTIADQKHVPMVTPSSTAVDVTRGHAYVFRTCFTNAQEGNVAARFVKDELHRTKAAIFYAAQNTYSIDLATAFRAAFARVGGTVVLEKAYQEGDKNFTTALEEVKRAAPDVVFAPVYYEDMIEIARQAKAVGIPGSSFFGCDAWDSASLLAGAGEELEGAYLTDLFAPDMPRPEARAFVGAFRAKFGVVPSSMAAQGYVGARVLFDAMGRAATETPDAIRDALAATKDYDAATGAITIDAEHNAEKPVVVVRVAGKAFRYVNELRAEP